MYCKRKGPGAFQYLSLILCAFAVLMGTPAAAQGIVPVWVDPAVAFQGDEPMTFTAHVPPPYEAASYEWRLDDEDDILGTEPTLTLAPTLTDDEVLTVTVTDAEGNRGSAVAFIITGDTPDEPPPSGGWIHVNIDPPVLFQGQEPLTFHATVHDGEPVDSYVWQRDDTGEVLGNTEAITLDPVFEITTPISLTVTRGDDRGQAWATVMVEIDDPNGDWIPVDIDPPLRFQGEEDLTFSAVLHDDLPVDSFTWRREDTGDIVGDTQTITLDPVFEVATSISLTVTRGEASGEAWATVMVGPGDNHPLFVMIDPPVVFQEPGESIEFHAIVNMDDDLLTFEWLREDTGEVVGTDDELELDPVFTEPTPISLTVTDNNGNTGHAIAMIMTDVVIPDDSLDVHVNPEFVLQGADPMTFTAVTPAGVEIATYEWYNDETGAPLGNTEAITLDPVFTEFTVISVTVTDVEGRRGEACALIATDDDPGAPLVAIDPPMIIQESETMEFEAEVADELDVTSYTWTNLNTGEVLGDDDEIKLAPIFEEITTLGLTVTTDTGDVYDAQALIIVPGDVPPLFFVQVEPAIQYQGDTPMTFTAQVEQEPTMGIESYAWMVSGSDQVLGTEATITLDPTFEATTELLLRVVNTNGDEAWSSGLIVVEETIPNQRVTIDPRVTVQGAEAMHFTAQIADDEAVLSYEWFNERTGEPLGTGDSIELAPTFTQPTPIGVRVTFVTGQIHYAFALILVTDVPNTSVSIDPGLVVQGEQLMNFNVNIPDTINVASITWRNAFTNEVLGQDPSLTLEPNFTISTTIAVDVASVSGTVYSALALIVVEDVSNTYFYLPTSPTVQSQGVDPVTITAMPPAGMVLETIEWRNILTDELLGTGETLTFAEQLTQTTPIHVTAVTDAGDQGIGFALVLVHPSGADPNHDGNNDINDLHSQLPEWNRSQSILELMTINIGF